MSAEGGSDLNVLEYYLTLSAIPSDWIFEALMRSVLRYSLAIAGAFVTLMLLHAPLLRLPYYWDEAGYYIPSALDFYRHGLLIPMNTFPTGHTPFVPVYLAGAWRLFGISPLVTRCALTLLAALTLVVLYRLARLMLDREGAAWTCVLLAVSPLFFAQTTLAHLDLAAALFTTLAILCLLRSRHWNFTLASSLAILSKETAVVLLPVAWVYAWWQGRRGGARLSVLQWFALASPLSVAAAWAIYYHHSTGYWTGNSEYLQYNVFSTLNPLRILFSLLRRLYEVFIGGFQWWLMLAAFAGWRQSRQGLLRKRENQTSGVAGFHFLAGGIVLIYLALLSGVGGAILPRYLLPVFPVLYLAAVGFVLRLHRPLARAVLVLTVAGFIASWFINPPYPFPFEDNLAYADFIQLHQRAARFLQDYASSRSANAPPPRVLTAWPATDELLHPDLGYVNRPLTVVPLQGFSQQDFAGVAPDSYDLVYLYSRHWQPRLNELTAFQAVERLQAKYFDYSREAPPDEVASQLHLRKVAEFANHGQWIRIYTK